MKSVETRDSELTQMNKSYFDELQRHVDDTSEELRRTFAGNNIVYELIVYETILINLITSIGCRLEK